MTNFITLTCPSCGAKLQITGEIDRFACAACGNEHIVNRSGGIVSPKPLIDSMKGVKVGLDKTSSELAIVRLNKEIPELVKLYEAKLSASVLAAKKVTDNVNSVNGMNSAISIKKKEAERLAEKAINSRIDSSVLVFTSISGSLGLMILIFSSGHLFGLMWIIGTFIASVFLNIASQSNREAIIKKASPENFLFIEPDQLLIQDAARREKEAQEYKLILDSKKKELDNHRNIVSNC